MISNVLKILRAEGRFLRLYEWQKKPAEWRQILVRPALTFGGYDEDDNALTGTKRLFRRLLKKEYIGGQMPIQNPGHLRLLAVKKINKRLSG